MNFWPGQGEFQFCAWLVAFHFDQKFEDGRNNKFEDSHHGGQLEM